MNYVHGEYGFTELFFHAFSGSSPLPGVAVDAAPEADFGIEIDEYFQIQVPADLVPEKSKDSVDDDCFPLPVDGVFFSSSRVGGKIVYGDVYGAAVCQSFYVGE